MGVIMQKPEVTNSLELAVLPTYPRLPSHQTFSRTLATSLALSSDSRYLLTLSKDSGLQQWDLSSESVVRLDSGKEPVTIWTAFKNANRCLWVEGKSAMTVWDLDERRAVAKSEATEEQEDSKQEDSKQEDSKQEDSKKDACLPLCLEVLADGETAIQASDDSQLRIWALRDCSVRGELTVPSPVLCLAASLAEVAFLSGGRDFKVRLWCKSEKVDSSPQLPLLSDFREVWCVTSHSSPVTALSWLHPDDSKSFVSGAEDGTVTLWESDGELPKALRSASKCTFAVSAFAMVDGGTEFISCGRDDPLLEWWQTKTLEVLEVLPGSSSLAVSRDSQFYVTTYSDLTISLQPLFWQRATKPSEEQKCSVALDPEKPLSPELARLRLADNTNILHLSVTCNHSQNLQTYLKSGVPSLRSPSMGSPLSIALKSSNECRDVILKFLIRLSGKAEKDEDVLAAFYPYTEDLLPLMQGGCMLLVPFLDALVRRAKAHQPLLLECPSFLKQIVLQNLPYRSVSSNFVDFVKKSNESSFFTDDHWMQLHISAIPMNLESGSEGSLKLLEALIECPNTSVLNSAFASMVIRQKWDELFRVTLGLTLAYVAMLVCLVVLVFEGNSWASIPFLVINIFFLLYERVQLSIEGLKYLIDPLNHVDVCRGFASIVWVVRLMMGQEFPKWLTLVVCSLCFLRGFTYFRSFEGTRIYVYMTNAVLAQSAAFFVILAYTVFAFGILFSVLSEQTDQGLGMALTYSFSMTLGAFDSSSFSTLEWVFFTLASITNIIVMLNLLISILGDAFSTVKETTPEKDLRIQLTLLLEYGRMYPTMGKVEKPAYVWMCNLLNENERQNIGGDDEEETQTDIGQRVSGMEKKLSAMRKQLAGVEEKLGEILAYIKQRS